MDALFDIVAAPIYAGRPFRSALASWAMPAGERFLGQCSACGMKLAIELDADQSSDPRVKCGRCGAVAKLAPLVAMMSAGEMCGSACMGAVGPSCSCQCGGENHGASWL